MFETIVADAARELGVPLPHPHLSANILTFLPVMIPLRGWSLRNDPPPAELIDEISEFVVRGLGFVRGRRHGGSDARRSLAVPVGRALERASDA